MPSRHVVRDAFRYLRYALRSPWTLQELRGTTSDALGRLATIENVNIPFLEEIRRAQVINAALVISERYPVQRRVLDVPQAPYPVFNPGLVQVGANYLSIVRCSTLINFRDGHFECATEQHNTTSYLLTIDADYQVLNRQLMDDSAVRGPGSPAAYGIEDVRLFLHEGKVWGIGAGIAPGDQQGELSVTQVAFEVEGTRIARLHVGPRPTGSTCEKNWVPVLADGKVWLNYSLDPTQFIEFRHGEFMVPEGLASAASFELRNGTPFIPWGRGYMALAHSPPLWWNNRAHYLHHVVILDGQRRLVEVSSGFFLVKRGTEFACGLCRQGDKLVVSLGIADRYAVLLEMPVSAITDLVIATPD